MTQFLEESLIEFVLAISDLLVSCSRLNWMIHQNSSYFAPAFAKFSSEKLAISDSSFSDFDFSSRSC